MIKRLLLLLLISCSSTLFAQTIKTDVLVIGGSPDGVAAAIQCAGSKVKTILVAENIQLENAGGTNETLTVDANRSIPSGIWGEFRKHVRDYYKNTAGFDTACNSPLKFKKNTGDAILKKMTDTVKNLRVELDASFKDIKKDGQRWEVSFSQNGKKVEIKALVVVDATENGSVAAQTGDKFSGEFVPFKDNGESKLYRTAIATGESWPGIRNNKAESPGIYPPYPYWYVPVNAFLGDVENLLVIEKTLPVKKTMEDLPMQLELGQGAGTVAAYCAFFRTITKNLKVRAIQGELLDFKGYLLPFTDILQSDPDWRAIQQIGATGLLKGKDEKGRFAFMPDEPVATAEIQPVLTEIYTRAFLWFRREKPAEKFTLGNTLSFISDYTLTDPAILKASIQKAWKTQFKFKSDFDLTRPITRREFAVLANKYLNPFSRTVDLSGRLVN